MPISGANTFQPGQTLFERIRQVDPDGLEFWSARDLMSVLEYTNWRNFTSVLLKAQIACENSGYDPTDHFVGAIKMVAMPEDLPTADSIKKLERAEKKRLATPKTKGKKDKET